MYPNSIKRYYSGSTIFVTGGTGYLGKVLIEKLLRSCSDIECIYVLMRSKRGASGDDRLEQLKSSQIFDRIRVAGPETLSKLRYLNGDIAMDKLGLSDADEELLKSSVNFVFHCAATVLFNTPIRDAINTNTLGTKRILDLFRDAKHLRKLVYASTAYSNPTKEVYAEKVYKSLLNLDLDWYVKCADVFPEEKTIQIMHQALGSFPNTYTLTKFLAEQLVEDYRSRFGMPAVIVRPSIISPSYEEPFPGWLDSFTGMNGFLMEISRGSVSSLQFDPKVIIDVIPLDIVCNHLIVAAWFDTEKPSNDIRVINCKSGGRNGVSYQDLFGRVVKYSREFPSKYTMFYPGLSIQLNPIVHFARESVHTMLPAYVADIGLRLVGKKPISVIIQNKLKSVSKLSRFISHTSFQFHNQSVIEMQQAVGDCVDSAEFPFDICAIDWDEYIKRCVLGTQKFMLKCDDQSLPSARSHLKRLRAAWYLYYASLGGLLGYSIMSKL